MTQPAWIKMRVNLETDPRVIRLATALGLSAECPHRMRTACAIGLLHKTWALADAHSEDGTLPAYTPEVLDDVVGVPGWCEALLSVGWIVVSPDGLTIPDFSDHNGASAKRRANEAKRKGAVRKKSASDADKDRTLSSSSSPSLVNQEIEVSPDDPLRGASERLREGFAKAQGFTEIPDWLPPKLLELDEHFRDVRGGPSISVRAWQKLIEAAVRDQAKFEADLDLTYERSAKNLQDSSASEPKGPRSTAEPQAEDWQPWPEAMPDFMRENAERYLSELWDGAGALHELFPEMPRATLQQAFFDRASLSSSPPGSSMYFGDMIGEPARAEVRAWLHRAASAVTQPAKARAILNGGMRRVG